MKRLDQETRRMILQLKGKGLGSRAIARIVRHSRKVVMEVLASGQEEPPASSRTSLLDPHREEVERLLQTCQGNLVRVHEELLAQGLTLSYSTLAGYAHRESLGKPPRLPAGRYQFGPGEEMQHDTSAHRVTFASGHRICQCASLTLCYSRMGFCQYYQRFTRLECKTFLSEALQYLTGACSRCMVDNTHVVVLHGTGSNAVMVPEMAAFAERLGFTFVAHAVGDANRSAHVERRFHHYEHNFLAGRIFADIEDLNRQAIEFCDKYNRTPKRHLKASPLELFAAEQPALVPVPPVMPEVYRLSFRMVDLEGYINVSGNSYSVPYELIGRQVEVREGLRQVRAYVGANEVASHARIEPGLGHNSTDKRHRPPRSCGGRRVEQPLPEEATLRTTDPCIDAYVTLLRQRSPGRAVTPIRSLYRIVQEYPSEAVLPAVRTASQFGLINLARLETMVLRNLAGRLFPEEPWSDPQNPQEGDDE